MIDFRLMVLNLIEICLIMIDIFLLGSNLIEPNRKKSISHRIQYQKKSYFLNRIMPKENFAINCIVLYGDAWCCMVQHDIAWYCLVLHGIAWYCIVLHGTALYSMVLQGNAQYCMILYGIDLYYIVSNFVYVSAQCLMVLHVIALFFIVLCGVARYCMVLHGIAW